MLYLAQRTSLFIKMSSNKSIENIVKSIEWSSFFIYRVKVGYDRIVNYRMIFGIFNCLNDLRGSRHNHENGLVSNNIMTAEKVYGEGNFENSVSLFCFHLIHQITNRSALAVRQLCIIIITILSWIAWIDWSVAELDLASASATASASMSSA